ncbi:MAG: topoisomerase C-terminal repeat-containing protein, partial [Verrucomicrobiota bacterium]
LTSPSMTGDWEAKLRQMEQGSLGRPEFMKEIIHFTKDVVEKARAHMTEMVNRPFPDLEVDCPACTVDSLKTTDATYECREADCTFKISKYIAGRELQPEEAKTLFLTKFLEERDGFVSRFNKPFSAALKLEQQVSKTGKLGKWKTDFVFDNDEEVTLEDLSEDQIIGSFTHQDDEHKVYQTEKSYLAPTLKTKKNPEGIRVSKRLLAHEITAEEALTILRGEKTPQINDFVSNRTKRKFSAFLKYDFEEDRPTFEFPPRKSAKKAPKKST